MESQLHPYSSFVTLTYNDAWLPLPVQGKDGTLRLNLDPGALSAYMKRLRSHLNGRSIRFFGVGEYGFEGERPHYHLLLYGVHALMDVKQIHAAWNARDSVTGETTPIGYVSATELTPERVAYTCQYTLKKMTNANHRDLDGRNPEYMRSSRRPGIGRGFVPALSRTLTDTAGGDAHRFETSDVFKEIRVAGKRYPLDQYIIDKMREETGQTSPHQVPDWLHEKWVMEWEAGQDLSPDPRNRREYVEPTDEERRQAWLRAEKAERRMRHHGTL